MGSRRLLILMVLGAWLLLGPIAMAFGGCDGVCEGACGVVFALASAVPSATMAAPLIHLTLLTRSHLPRIEGHVPEPPPKFLPLVA